MTRAILAVKYTPAAAPAQLRKAVSGFLRYIQHRDQDRAEENCSREVDGMVKYVAYRDRSGKPILFDRNGRVGAEQRRLVTEFVSRSVAGSKAQLARDKDGQVRDRRRAVYRFVLSPEHARGLDLEKLAHATMAQLESDLGASLPPWIAALHRNTAHPHVHIVMPARQQLQNGTYRQLGLSRERLANMKGALGAELERQLGRPERAANKAAAATLMRTDRTTNEHPAHPTRALLPVRRETAFRLKRAGFGYQRDAEREAERFSRQASWDLAA